MVRAPACWILVLYLAKLYRCPGLLHSLRDFHVGITHKEVLERAGLFSENHPVVYRHKYRDISLCCDLKIFFAVCRREMYEAAAGGSVHKVLGDYKVYRAILCQFVKTRYHME